MKFYLMRHGKTSLNGKGILLGRSDPGLLDQNDSDLIRKIDFLKNISWEYLIHSGTRRTNETVSIIQKNFSKEIPSCFDERLQELDFGDWELKSYDWLYQHQRELFLQWLDDPFSISPPQGETLVQLKDRLFSFFEEWSHKDDGLILIVTHGGPIRLLWSMIHHTSFYGKEVLPASLFYLDWQKQNIIEIKE